MNVRNLEPGDLVTFRGEPYTLGQHLGDGMNTILQWAHDDSFTACVPSALEVVDGKIDDRRYGAGEPKGPGATLPPARDTYSGDRLSHAGGPTGPFHSPARPTAHGSTPGIPRWLYAGALRLARDGHVMTGRDWLAFLHITLTGTYAAVMLTWTNGAEWDPRFVEAGFAGVLLIAGLYLIGKGGS